MNIKHLIPVIATLLMMTVPAMGQPQQGDSLLWWNFAYERDSDPWLMSPNASALTRLGDIHLSEAEAGVGWADGGMVNYHQPARLLQADATVESLYRLSSRTVVYGRMRYDNLTGHDMAGSAFLNPSNKPFDIVEDSLTNLGKKHSDTYQLTGALGVNLHHGVAVGARLDYMAANYAKYKDLRHKNSLMNLMATAGVYVPIGKAFQLGGHFLYRRDTESLQFSTYGKTDKTYKSLIDYGAFIGEVEQFGVERFTDANREMPLFDEYLGGGMQMELRLAQGLAWYNAMGISNRDGYYGSKSPYSSQLTHHESTMYDFSSRLTFRQASVQHVLDFTMCVENLVNYEENFREKKNDAGSNYHEYYDPVKTANKVWMNGEASYAMHLGMHGSTPVTTVKGGVQFFQRKLTAYDYPYFRRQKIGRQEAFLMVCHNLSLGKGMMSLMAEGRYSKGYGKPFEDGTMALPSDKQVPPPQMETYLYREYEYLTAPQYSILLSMRHAWMMPYWNVAAYAKATICHHKGNGAIDHLTGRDHTLLRLSIGCVF